MSIYSMEQLKEKAVRIVDGMEFCYNIYGESEQACVNLKDMSPENHKKEFSCRGMVVSFVDENGNLFIIPDLKKVRKTLTENGYIYNENFFTTFRHWTHPIDDVSKWRNLLEEKDEELK